MNLSSFGRRFRPARSSSKWTLLACACLTAPARAQDAHAASPAPPTQRILFAEIPDVPELLTAYETAPMVQMIRDDAVQASVRSLLDAAGVEVETALAAALTQAGIPEPIAREPLAFAQRQIAHVHSLSIAVEIVGDPDRLSERVGQLTHCAQGLVIVGSALDAYRNQHDGAAPAALSDLGLAADQLTDPWGHAFEYDAQGETVRSLGADGQPGGRGFDADIESADPASALAQVAGDVITALVALRLDSDEVATQAFQAAQQGLQGASWTAGEARDIAPPGAAGRGRAMVLRLASAEKPFLEGALARSGPEIVLAVGNHGEARALSLLAQRADAGSSKATCLRGEVPANVADLAALASNKGGAMVIQGWLRTDALTRLMRGIPADISIGGSPAAKVLDLPGARVAFQLMLQDSRFVQEVLFAADPSAPSALSSGLELFRFVGREPLPETMWGAIPADAIGLFAISIDPGKIFATVRKGFQSAAGAGSASASADAEAGGEDAARASATGDSGDAAELAELSKLEAKYGFQLEQDIFGAMGHGAAFYMQPVTSVLSMMGTPCFALELNDPARFQKGLEGVLRMLEDQAGGDFRVRFKPYREQPMWTISFGSGDEGESNPFAGPFTITPTLSIVGKHLYVNLTSARAKREVKRILGNEGGQHPLLSLSNRPPPGAGLVGYMDMAALVDGTYEGARAMLGMVGGFGQNLPFDPEALPDAATFTHFFRPSIAWGRAEGERAYHLFSESSFGPETPLGLFVGGALMALGVRSSRNVEPVEPVELEVVLDEGPGQAAQSGPGAEQEKTGTAQESAREALRRFTLAAMSELATRLEVYRLDVGKYPAALEDLLKPTANYPDGFVPSGKLPLDGWQRPFVYVPSTDRSSFELHSMGDDGVDDKGRGDDVPLQ